MQRIDLGGQDEVVFRETVDGVGPDVEADPVIVDVDVGVVAFFLGEIGHPVHELHRRDKIFKLELFERPS